MKNYLPFYLHLNLFKPKNSDVHYQSIFGARICFLVIACSIQWNGYTCIKKSQYLFSIETKYQNRKVSYKMKHNLHIAEIEKNDGRKVSSDIIVPLFHKSCNIL